MFFDDFKIFPPAANEAELRAQRKREEKQKIKEKRREERAAKYAAAKKEFHEALSKGIDPTVASVTGEKLSEPPTLKRGRPNEFSSQRPALGSDDSAQSGGAFKLKRF